MKVKICGITTMEDALASAQAGADMLGFNFYPPSPRYIEPEVCAAIVSTLRKSDPSVIFAGVFVNETPPFILSILERCGLDIAQCSGDETPGVIQKCGHAALKALRPATSNDLRAAAGTFPTRPAPPAFLVDAYRPGEFGGTGQTADWSLARALALRLPILLAGGLTPQNVTTAVHQVQPWGVDVASGVEVSPGRKDPALVNAFIAAAHSAEKD